MLSISAQCIGTGNSASVNLNQVLINRNSAWTDAAVAESLALQREQVAWQRRQALAAEALALAHAPQHLLAAAPSPQWWPGQLHQQLMAGGGAGAGGSGGGRGGVYGASDGAGEAEEGEEGEEVDDGCVARDLLDGHEPPRLVAAGGSANALLSVSDDDANKIEHLVAVCGWTQARLARLLGCSQAKVSKLLAELGVSRRR